MYQVSVEQHFDAAHFLRGYRGKCEAVHGHRFRVVVRVRAALAYGLGSLIEDIAPWLVIGTLVGGAIAAFVPDDFLARSFPNPYLQMVAVLGVAVPLYVCATGSVPVAAALVLYAVVFHREDTTRVEHAPAVPLTLEDIPVDGQRAYEMLQQVCTLGSRMSGSVGSARQREILTEHFEKLGGRVELQSFSVAHPVDRSRVEMANLIVHWHPKSRERVLLCAHYDTRPFPDRDPDRSKRNGLFVGANDGASALRLS